MFSIPGATGEAKKKKKKKKSKKKKVEQSDPPRVGLSKLFPSGIYPEGEIQHYKDEYVLYSPLYHAYLRNLFFFRLVMPIA